MLIPTYQSLHFMGGHTPAPEAQWDLVGVPLDVTCSYRPGTRFAPNTIREASWALETYSPKLNRSLDDVRFHDKGDLILPFGNRDKSLQLIHAAVSDTLNAGKQWIGLGGEHLATLPTIEAYLNHYPGLCLIQLDAHADLRKDYLGETLSHATTMRRISELIPAERIAQIGIRSGTQDEFAWMNAHHTLLHTPDELISRLDTWKQAPIFLTIDLDVLDPSIFPATGAPEPNGMALDTFFQWLYCLHNAPIVGMDVMEFSPTEDPHGNAAIIAAQVCREALLLNPTLRDQESQAFLPQPRPLVKS